MQPRTLLNAMAARLARPGEAVSMGTHAALRRMDPLRPGTAAPALYGFLSDAGLELERVDDIAPWALVTHALALARGRHRNGQVGDALVSIRLGEARLKQLLSADFDLLCELLPRLARRLDGTSEATNFAPLMDLIFAAHRQDSDALDRARLAIARSYVIAEAKQARNEK